MYLSPAEYAAYGIPDATTAQVLAASRRIDAELGRPEGLLYGIDADGLPAYMLGLPATATYTLSDPVVAGLDTEITVTDATLTPARIGDIALIDRTGQCEAATITAADGNTLTLSALQHPHPAGATVEFGRVLVEERTPLTGGYRFPLARAPVARVLSVSSRSWESAFQTLANSAGIGLNTATNRWEPLDMTGFDLDNGVLDLAPGVTRTGTARARVRYVAGWTEDSLPPLIKQAVADLVSASNDASDLPDGVKTLKAGDGTVTRFDRGDAGGLTGRVRALLAPFRTYRLA